MDKLKFAIGKLSERESERKRERERERERQRERGRREIVRSRGNEIEREWGGEER